jgi:hypothetical protein
MEKRSSSRKHLLPMYVSGRSKICSSCESFWYRSSTVFFVFLDFVLVTAGATFSASMSIIVSRKEYGRLSSDGSAEQQYEGRDASKTNEHQEYEEQR